MNPRLTRGEYWLLARAVLYRMPLRLLSLPEGPPWNFNTIQETLNAESHGMSAAVLARTLVRMRQRGWIEVDRGIKPDSGSFDVDPQAMRAALAERGRLHEGPYYGLTPDGGMIWEQFARPRWPLFVEDEEDESAEGDGVSTRRVIVGDRAFFDRYMRAVRGEVAIEVGSEALIDVSDWKPAYWKTPLVGIRWDFRCRQRPIDPRYDCTRSSRLKGSWCEWI